jgi:hypothetical protein
MLRIFLIREFTHDQCIVPRFAQLLCCGRPADSYRTSGSAKYYRTIFNGELSFSFQSGLGEYRLGQYHALGISDFPD